MSLSDNSNAACQWDCNVGRLSFVVAPLYFIQLTGRMTGLQIAQWLEQLSANPSVSCLIPSLARLHVKDSFKTVWPRSRADMYCLAAVHTTIPLSGLIKYIIKCYQVFFHCACLLTPLKGNVFSFQNCIWLMCKPRLEMSYWSFIFLNITKYNNTLKGISKRSK